MSVETRYQKQFSGNVADFGRVAVLYGGTSAERSVSLQSGAAILNALQEKGVNAFAIDIGEDVCQQLQQAEFDCAFIALHGMGGEDGKVQALLDLMGKPYTGSDHAASALAMNKLHTKQVWQSWGLPTPPYLTLEAELSLETVLDTLGHVFVKPVHEGSSYGVSPARSLAELEQAAAAAKQFDSTVIAEKLIHGEEYSVAVLGSTVLPPIQIKFNGGFYDFNAKYESDKTEYLCPAPLDEQDESILKAIAGKAFRTVGCKGWGRVDFMRNQSGEFFLLEVNTVPGMTSHSLVPMAAKAIGLSFGDLVLEVLAMATNG
ncbi:D-alanine--D-alanine ligase [Agaribacterium haliotis]|uniref:D-alanine--D-alanine ligase n=1 Tax=Agaribacterium haliotis TaxID=2013869 RepID=UPI000BB58545|nr:D-alanine--D-alanine ligase [Agaribacterium haliotis]